MILLDVLKYFAGMPHRDGVMKAFARKNPKHPGYEALKAEVEALPTPVLLPELTDFVFGDDATTINETIRNIKGRFMMVDYGIFQSNPIDQVRNRDASFLLTVFIAQPQNLRNNDMMERNLVMDDLLVLAKRMIDRISADDEDRCSQDRYMDSNITIMPIQPLVLLNCDGWEITFRKDANALFFE